jgi:hypothetical protein
VAPPLPSTRIRARGGCETWPTASSVRSMVRESCSVDGGRAIGMPCRAARSGGRRSPFSGAGKAAVWQSQAPKSLQRNIKRSRLGPRVWRGHIRLDTADVTRISPAE